jgi:hypothetical protein
LLLLMQYWPHQLLLHLLRRLCGQLQLLLLLLLLLLLPGG